MRCAFISLFLLLLPAKNVPAGQDVDLWQRTSQSENKIRLIAKPKEGPATNEKQAFAALAHQGVLIVASAGNYGPSSPPKYPASYSSVISVSAIDEMLELWQHSNANEFVDLTAPGDQILSTASNGGYGAFSGTALATAFVSGVAALLWSYKPEASASEIREALIRGAMDLGAEGRDDYFGYGLVQAMDSLEYLNRTNVPSVSTSPSASPTPFVPSQTPTTSAPADSAPVLAPGLPPIPPSPGHPPCNVCGPNDERVTNLDTIVTITGQPPFTCQTFQLAGDLGHIDAQFCPLISIFAMECGCVASPTSAVPSQTPTATASSSKITIAPTYSPVEPPIPPSPGHPPCNICGQNDERVTNLDAIVEITGQSPVSCQVMQRAGDHGFIRAQFCPFIPPLVTVCGCATPNLTSSPVSLTTAPTTGAAPVAQNGTPSPSGSPVITLTPTVVPSPAPGFVSTMAPSTWTNAGSPGGDSVQVSAPQDNENRDGRVNQAAMIGGVFGGVILIFVVLLVLMLRVISRQKEDRPELKGNAPEFTVAETFDMEMT